jgi:hypothetical protein
MTAMFLYFILKVLAVATRFLRAGVCILAVLICAPSAIPTSMLYTMQSKIHRLELIVRIKKGDVSSKCMRVLVCTGVMMLLTIFK